MFARSVLVKVVVLGFLVGMLAVPLLAIWALTADREHRRRDVAKEVGGIWGGAQLVAGPVLSIPFDSVTRAADGKETRVRDVLRVLPESLEIAGAATVEKRRRGIYQVPVYTVRLKLSGAFRKPDSSTLGASAEAVAWDLATLSLGGFEARAVLPELSVTLDGSPMTAEPDPDTGLWPAGIATAAKSLRDTPAGGKVAFEIVLPLRGSESLAFVAAGRTTSVALSADWPSPSFTGSLLPERHTVTDAAFTAGWRASSLGRNVPQSWRDSQIPRASAAERLDRSGFGAKLVTPVDVYTESGRATKYGILFVLLTFLAFFLAEVLQPANVHPVQYILVGAALCLFYLLLLSLAEQIGFTPAYVIAASATTVLVSAYSRFALGARRSAVRVALGLTGLYGFLFVLLRLEDYALVVGSLVLFAILASVMFLTRKVDWYNVGAVLAGSDRRD
jgi:inner membrane protein